MKMWGLLYIITPLFLLAYSDRDLDGVADEHDLCPNSTMLDIVDKRGCPIEKLVMPNRPQHHGDIIMGITQTKMATTHERQQGESLQIDYYYQNLSIQFQTAHYDAYGLGDSTLGLSYRLKPTSNLSLSMGVFAILPTYKGDFDNNKIDYKLSSSLNYNWKKVSIFLGGAYRLINDEDIREDNQTIIYQNSHTLYLGMGSYLLPTLYSSLIYSNSTSIYQRGEDLNTLSWYNHYIITPHWFSRFGYTKGLNETTSDQLYLSIGYYF